MIQPEEPKITGKKKEMGVKINVNSGLKKQEIYQPPKVVENEEDDLDMAFKNLNMMLKKTQNET